MLDFICGFRENPGIAMNTGFAREHPLTENSLLNTFGWLKTACTDF
jgi:hypothetical protein